MDLDRAFFIVGFKCEKQGLWIGEGPLSTLEEAAHEIFQGTAEDTEMKIFEFNPVEGYSRDVTEDAARLPASDGWEYGLRDGFLIVEKSYENEGSGDPNDEHRDHYYASVL